MEGRAMKTFWMIFLALMLAMPLAISCGDDDDDDNDSGDDDDSSDDDDDSVADDDDDNDDDTVDPFLNPEEPGPFTPGNTTFFFEDTSRQLKCAEGNRWLMVEVWYPGKDGDYTTENRTYDFFLDRRDEVEQALLDAGMTPEEELNDLPTGSYRDIPLSPDAGPMPMIFFSHGFSGNRFQNYTMSAYLASHGYVVVTADHTCNSSVTLTPTDVILFDIGSLFYTLGERKDDIVFLIDQFTTEPPEMFEGRLDNDKVLLWGHSFGGLTVTEVFKYETRAKGLLQMAVFGFPPLPVTVTAPSMYFWGKQDKWMFLFEGWHDQIIAQAPTPKYELEFFDTGHFAFADMCQYSPNLAVNGNGCGTESRIGGGGNFTNPDPILMHEVLNAYATAFFGAALFDYDELWEYLDENHWPEMFEYYPETE
jgi:dienelactone hydrolase